MRGVRGALRSGQRRHHDDAAPDDRLHRGVVQLLVARQMGKAVDTRGHEVLHVRQVEDVRVHLEPVLVRFLDDGVRHVGRHARRAAVAVVHPDLDEVHLQRRLLAYGLAPLLRRGDLVGDTTIARGAGTGVGKPDAAARR